jgi:hypothetical protein
MRKAILTFVILGTMFSVAQAAGSTVSGDFGYRNDDLEVGAANSNRDRFRFQLKVSSNVNDKAKVVFGVRTGSVKSSWVDMGDNNSLKNAGLNLAYVEYAAAPFAKVTLGKMNQPWHTDALFFDNDIKPEGVAVALKHNSGLSASAFKLKLTEGGVAKDSDLVGLQVGMSKKLAALDVAVHASTLKQEVNVGLATIKHDQLVLGASAKKEIAGVPVKLFVEQLTNDEAKTHKKATAYGVTFGNAKNAGDWEVSVLKQDAEANALSAVWTDSDFGGEATLHDGTAIRAAYAVADGWKVRGSLFDVEVGANKTDYKRLMVDLVFAF